MCSHLIREKNRMCQVVRNFSDPIKSKPPSDACTLREESSQTNIILPYKLLAAILSAVCSVIQQS